MDNLTKEQRRKNMQAIRSNKTSIEILLGKEIWAKGLRYRRNDKTVNGKPDFTFKKYKLAVFCDSEFWHGKDWETNKYKIKSNREYWFNKIERNIKRDNQVNYELSKLGWNVIRLWAKDIEKDTDNCVSKILLCIANYKSLSQRKIE